MIVSLLMLTIDRFELTSKTYETNYNNAKINLPADVQIETLICDNGSADKRIVQFFEHRPEVYYHRKNSINEGVGRAFNQLYLRSEGEIIVLLGNDIVLPPGWLAEGINYAIKVPNSGIIGFDWGHGGLPPCSAHMGIAGHWLTPTLDKVFGVWIMRKLIIETLGFFCEKFHPYGLEDSDFNNRVNIAGFNSVYVPNMKSEHLGNDVGENTSYRKMKDESLGRNLDVLHHQITGYHIRGIVEDLPPEREPL